MRQFFVVVSSILFFFPQTFAQSKGKSGASGFYFEETFMPKIVGFTDTTSNPLAPGAAKETGSGFDSKTTLGYVFGGAWFVGLTSNSYTLDTKRSNRVGGDEGLKESTKNSQLGATVGYLKGNWKFMLTSYLSGQKSVDTKNFDATSTTGDVTFKYKEASGTELSVGYIFPITSYFGIGPSLIYRSLTFGKQSKVNRLTPAEDYPYTSLFSDATETNLDILISLVFRF